MKRIAILSALLLVALSLFAAETRLTISPSDMKDGETKTLVDGDATITLKRSGDNLDVNIQGAGKTQHVVIKRDDGTIVIERNGVRRKIEMPDMEIPRFEMPPMPKLVMPEPPMRHMRQTWFVCPKDHTMLRVPTDKSNESYKCPVDGTKMEKRRGAAFEFFWDDAHGDGL